MQDLNTAHVLKKLCKKLPRYFRTKWVEKNSRIKSMQGQMADFAKFTEFIRDQAELANDPIFLEEFTKTSSEDKVTPY